MFLCGTTSSEDFKWVTLRCLWTKQVGESNYYKFRWENHFEYFFFFTLNCICCCHKKIYIKAVLKTEVVFHLVLKKLIYPFVSVPSLKCNELVNVRVDGIREYLSQQLLNQQLIKEFRMQLICMCKFQLVHAYWGYSKIIQAAVTGVTVNGQLIFYYDYNI